MERQQRNILQIVIWLVALVSTPYTTLLAIEFDPTLQPHTLLARLYLVPAGAIAVNALLFLMALFVSRLCADLDVLQETGDADRSQSKAMNRRGAEGAEKSRSAVLKILRMSRRSPLRGHVSEQALIYSVNDVTPTTAAEANRALVEGLNEVEWIDPKGELRHTRFTTREHDLQAQFEQVEPPSLKGEA
ncbi:hypothetical protein R6258_00665 [Halomonas sp. HP20-15]|uniref:hypothetical protein n=1 Tax=Halomonas sp. HP20-15 TaxID=3085901 RepID=UPI002981CBC4|nr:hypothetical protein [Halomonas sp. HP20-15]MDW5375417.1 hypothetical protein [Halomonas sp. HP20-15]